jgi:quercetin dioxygenase-like cupin family protein
MPLTFPFQPSRTSAAGLCVLLACLAQSAVAADVKVFPPGSIGFKADANVPGVSVAVVDGNPKEGPYTVRAKFEPGLKIPAHMHPDTRVVTVISGTYYFAQGDKYDEKAIQGYAPGTVIVIPANTPHYAGSAEEGVIVQESGVGPTGITLTGK